MLKQIITIIMVGAMQTGMASVSLSPADSIRRALPRLHGEAKLDALANLSNLIDEETDEQKSLKINSEYIAEAVRQKNTKVAGHAMAVRIGILHNYNDIPQIETTRASLLGYMKDHARWNDYYESWSMIADAYLSNNKMMITASEARNMYEDARSRNNRYGLGVSRYILGHVYFAQNNLPLADKAYAEAVRYLSYTKDGDPNMLVTAYSDYADVLSGMKSYKKMEKIVSEWKETIDLMKSKETDSNANKDYYNVKYKYCYLSMADIAMNTGRMDQAAKFLAKAESLAQGSLPIGHSSVLYSKMQYFQLKKDYKSALDACRQCEALLEECDDQMGLVNVRELKADILISMGRPAEAAYILQKLQPLKDSLYNLQSQGQMSELNTLYHLDELKMQKERMKLITIAVTAASILLVLILILYIVHQSKLRAKNRIIFEKLKEEMHDEEQTAKAQERIPEQELSTDELMYRRICKLVQEKQLYKGSEINREIIASELGTNYTYVATAIRTCAGGISVNDFLNEQRLKHAAHLLTDSDNQSVNEICDTSGFSSRTSFYRLFHDKFGMSPTEYRHAAKEKEKRETKPQH